MFLKAGPRALVDRAAILLALERCKTWTSQGVFQSIVLMIMQAKTLDQAQMLTKNLVGLAAAAEKSMSSEEDQAALKERILKDHPDLRETF